VSRRSQRRAGSSRLGAGAALALFVLALLCGAVLHPLGDSPHRCGTSAGHVDQGPDHAHDAVGCALCHLTRDLANTRPLSPPPQLLGAAATIARAPRPTGLATPLAPVRTTRSRAPPPSV